MSQRFTATSARMGCLVLIACAAGCGAVDDDAPRPGVSAPTAGATAGVGGGVAAGVGGGVAGSTAMPPSSTPIPCDVQQAAATCQGCHSSPTKFGAPMPLVTHEDFAKADYVVATTQGMMGQTIKVAELARMRLNDSAAPMPPTTTEMAPAHRTVLDTWLAAGAVAGTEADRTCMIDTMPPDTGVGGGLIARTELGEVCYDLPVHGGQTEDDTTKYDVTEGEHYAEWYYSVPWGAGEVASRFGAKFDNEQVLHHWLLYTDDSGQPPGSHHVVQGNTSGAQLLAGWGAGGNDVEMPDDVGLELPAPGTMIQVQWHFYNPTGQVQQDGTVVQVCTVPAGSRPKTASMTWLGTENLGGPFGMGQGTQEFSGTCNNDSGADINIVMFWPHMHKLGRNMRSSINGVDVFNKPFQHKDQIQYPMEPQIVLKPGESIVSTCTFMNDTGRSVGFGSSSDQEMCFQFAYAYPAHALDNGATGLNGASNNCW